MEDANTKIFDRDMRRVLSYHGDLVFYCRALAAINVDEKLFNSFCPRHLRRLKDNQQIRWRLEDKIRELLRKNGDFRASPPMEGTAPAHPRPKRGTRR